MGRVLLLLLALILASSGRSTAQGPTDNEGKVADEPSVSRIRYFPPPAEQPHNVCGGSERQPIIDEFEDRWVSQQLTAADEPSLYLATQRSGRDRPFILRFTWLRTFHTPVFIRIEAVADEKYRLTAKELSGTGGYEPGTIKRKVERDLPPEEVRQVRQLLAKTRLFLLTPKDCALTVLDGSNWVFELADGQGYHVMTRSTPKHGPVREAGMFLVGLSGWTFTDVY